MKHFAKAAVIAIILLSYCLTTFAVETSDVIFKYDIGNVEVFFDENTPFSQTQQELIAYYIAGDAGQVSAYNLICTLFGHNYLYDTVIAVTHKVMPTPPRCLQETYLMGVCSRCQDITGEVTSSEYIDCCP